MERKITIKGEASLATGLLLISFAVPLMVRADFGISTISSLPYVLSRIIDEISFGVWNPIFQVCLLFLLVLITRRFKSGYVVSFLIAALFGISLDFFTNVLFGLPTDLWSRLLYIIVSFPIMCVAIYLMVGSKVPLMMADSFINDLSTHLHITYRRMKTLFDIACMALSVALSMVFIGHLVGVGIGTIIMAFITGSGVHAANKVISRVIIIEPWSKTLGDMAK
jgi:uncharacterized protein